MLVITLLICCIFNQIFRDNYIFQLTQVSLAAVSLAQVVTLMWEKFVSAVATMIFNTYDTASVAVQ